MIPPELLKKLRKIEIFTSRRASEQLSGSYHSVFKGQGMAFSEVRQYSPGDDVRFIDWNVSARMADPYVKVFTEEREMTVMLLIDLSASSNYGKVPKRDTIAEVSALLAFSAISNNDRVGAILFTDQVEQFIPPRKGRSHVMRVVSDILRATPQHKGTNIQCALERLSAMKRKKTVAFLISDFQDKGFEKRLGLAAVKHDLVAVEVSDELENELPKAGLIEVEDIESGQSMLIDFSDRVVRERYAVLLGKERAASERLFQRYGVDTVRIQSGQDVTQPLTSLFRKRQRRLGGYR